MHKYILIPDSFKGTLSARDFCAVAREAIGRADPGAQVLSVPLADGGEGTVEAFLAACGGQRIECPCTGPYGGTAPGFYGLLPDGTAVVELAAAAGLPLAGTDLHPADATTYGVGGSSSASAAAPPTTAAAAPPLPWAWNFTTAGAGPLSLPAAPWGISTASAPKTWSLCRR